MNKHLNGSRESITSILLILYFFVGCDYHVDSVYLGRNEAGFLENVCMGNIEAVNEFLDNGGNVNLQDEPGMTPLHHAVNSDWKESHLEMIKLLIERGAIVNAIDDTHHTPLHMASNATVAGLLLGDLGAVVNAERM